MGLRSRISEGCTIKRAMIMGADFYETDEERAALIAKGGVSCKQSGQPFQKICTIVYHI